MKIQSMFGPYAAALQVVIDSSLDRFKPTWFQNYLTWGVPQTTLTFTDVVGSSRIEAAASVVNRSSSAPLRTRNNLIKYTGEIPAIKEKFAMREDDYRSLLAVQQSTLNPEAKKKVLLDLLFKDLNALATSPHKRIDMMCLEAISTGFISLTTTNNPDGVVLKSSLDLLMPSGNKTNAAVLWASSSTATPITDITTKVSQAETAGRKIGKILMSRTQFLVFAKAKEVIDSLISFNQLQKGAQVATLDKVNVYLQANLLPPIELVDQAIGVEKDGVISTTRPWSETNVAFIPDGPLGEIKNAFAIEQMNPVPQVSYATYQNALISKWSENDPWGEFTAVELNAFPSFAQSMDGIYLLAIAGF